MQAQNGPGRAAGGIEPNRLAGRRERGVGQRESQRLADHLRGCRGTEELASAPGSGAGAAADLGGVLNADLVLSKARAEGLDLGRILAGFRQKRNAAGNENGRSFPEDASAIIMAGRPLSQVAMPMTPLPVGRERMRRRSTMAASLRNGSESSMPVVP